MSDPTPEALKAARRVLGRMGIDEFYVPRASQIIDEEHTPLRTHIAELEAELADANEALAACRAEAAGKIRKLEEDGTRDYSDMRRFQARAIVAEARVEELEKDKERLDWLEARTASEAWESHHIHIHGFWDNEDEGEHAMTLREAIDAARAEGPYE